MKIKAANVFIDLQQTVTDDSSQNNYVSDPERNNSTPPQVKGTVGHCKEKEVNAISFKSKKRRGRKV